MSKIIFLNGCGSSGKTSIARSIQYLSDSLWVTLGVDAFISMLPYKKEDHYLRFVPDSNEHGPVMRVEPQSQGHDFFSIIPDAAVLFADKGQNLIIDEILFGDELLKTYAQLLKQHTVYSISVFCELSVMQEREILRGDRHIGLSNDQINRVHLGLRDIYDLKVDTTHTSPFECARQILSYIEAHPHPKAFERIRSI